MSERHQDDPTLAWKELGKNTLVYWKDDCIWCTKAKELLDSIPWSYTPLKLGVDFSRQDLIDAIRNAGDQVPDRLTLPQIMIDSHFVGGFDALTEYFKRKKV